MRRRDKMPLNLDDMLHLVKLVELSGGEPANLSEIATKLGLNRAYLYRVMERVDESLAPTPGSRGWRKGHRVIPPAEVRRLVRPFDSLSTDLDTYRRFPRVACGSAVSLILYDYVELAGRHEMEQIAAVPGIRARDIPGCLQDYLVDAALVHEASYHQAEEQLLRSQRGSLLEGLVLRPALSWHAVLVEPESPGPCDDIEWEPGSFADHLTQSFFRAIRRGKRRSGPLREEDLERDPRTQKRRAGSYLNALEMVRRGHRVRFVAPDILVKRPEEEGLPKDIRLFRSLSVTHSPEGHEFDDHGGWLEGRLVLVHRASDAERVCALTNDSAWRELHSRLSIDPSELQPARTESARSVRKRAQEKKNPPQSGGKS